MPKSHSFPRLQEWLYKIITIVLVIVLLPLGSVAQAQNGVDSALPSGDVDGNGVVDIEDSRLVNQYMVGQIDSLPHPENADATEDGEITIEDVLAIAQRVNGRSHVTVVGLEYGLPGKIYPGFPVRIEVFERFFPSEITSGTIRIKSPSTGYDSSDMPLIFEDDRQSLYYHLDTSGLTTESDYEVWVKLERLGNPDEERIKPDSSISLSARVLEIPYLVQVQDAYAPARGIPLDFVRTFSHDSAHVPYLGPFGRGWTHTFNAFLEEFTDGLIAFFGSDGFNRWFVSNGDGTYTASPGDYGTLIRNAGDTFQLREKDGLIYRFRSDLRLDYIQAPDGNRASCTYNGGNQLVEIRHSNSSSIRLEYNAHGRISKVIDHVGQVTTYEYSPDGIHLLKVTDPAGYATSYTYSLGQGEAIDHRLTSIAYPDDTHVFYTYDSEGRLTSIERDGGVGHIGFSYDADGATYITDAAGATTVVQVNERGQPIEVTNPEGAVSQFDYNSNHNLTRVIDPLNHVWTFGYDERGNVVQVADPLGDRVNIGYEPNFSKIAWMEDSLGRITTFAYNQQGNPTVITYPDGSTQRYTYDENSLLKSTRDGTGKTTLYSFDNQGQMTSLQNALGHVTQFSYDATGDLQSVADAKGHIICYERDIFGQLTRRTYADGSYEEYEYDEAGKLTGFTNRRGDKISYLYDTNGCLEWKVYPDRKKLKFNYDERGILSSVEVVSGETTTLDTYYEYDLLKCLTLVKVPGKVAPESYDVSFAYDASDNRRFMAYPDGYALSYEYDAANRLIRISDASDNTIVDYEYNAAGRRTVRTLGNGAYTTYDYDDMDRLTRLVNYMPDGTVQSQFEYTYNAAGMRMSMTTLEGVHTYTYDDSYQLTRVEYPDGRTVNYTFDEVGNRISVTDDDMVTNYTTNELDQYMSVGSETFEYDANGNLKTRTLGSNLTSYGWNEENRLVTVDRNGVHIDYSYDYQGRLITKKVDGQETRYIWDGLDLIAEMDSAGRVVKRYIYGATIDEVIVVTADGTHYWAQQDGLGSVVGTTSDSGVVTVTSSYDVYGQMRNGEPGPVPQRLAGMWWDKDAGLYYVRARWYEPGVGRFMTPDPIGIAGGLNLYKYAFNNPVKYVDLLGIGPGDGPPPGWKLLQTPPNLIGVLPELPLIVPLPESSEQLHTSDISDSPVNRTQGNNDYRGELKRLSGDAPWWTNFVPGPVWAAPLWDLLFPRPLGERPGEFPPDYRSGWVYLRSAGGWYYAGGVCPTFIQLPSHMEAVGLRPTHLDITQEQQLAGKITVPIGDCLLRSDIPIFGVAGGTNFKEYRVEYGEGENPTEWHLIEASTTPQPTTDVGISEIQLMQGDIDIRGNLATWNTGLKNWVHLPWHPPEDPTDFNGIYTIRLVVEGKDGQTIEDRVTCEVGRVIAQCFPGIAISPDKRVVLRFPEHSLTASFRVYTILPLSEVGEKIPPQPEGTQLIGQIYRIREPSDRFIKDVVLEFNVSKGDIQRYGAGHLGIIRYDVEAKEWLWFVTLYSLNPNSGIFSTTLTELPTPKAIYALGYDPRNIRSQLQADSTTIESQTPISHEVLIHDTFEDSTGSWKSRDHFVGGVVNRVKAAADGSYALQIASQSSVSNFAVTILDQPFDISDYPVMSFDYRIAPGIKTDFYLLVNGRWYNLSFTDEPNDFRNRDVNVANLGQLEGIVADDQWHSTSVNLYELLRQKTRNTCVDAIIMADWDIGGYMKLDFGRNDRGVAYYVDNFKLAAGPEYDFSDILVLDNFDGPGATNLFGGTSGTFSSSGTAYCRASVVEDNTTTNNNHVLGIDFDVTIPGSYGGYLTSLMDADIGNMKEVSLRLYAAETVPPMLLGLHCSRWVEAKVLVQTYLSPPDEDGWRSLIIPLSAFRGLPNLSSIEALFITFENKLFSGAGTILIDDIHFCSHPSSGKVVDFDVHDIEQNLLGGVFNTIEEEAAVISTGYHEDRTCLPETGTARISYGGSIGLDYGGGRFSYAIWETALLGFDARGFQNIVIKVRGENGGEKPNIWLDDGTTRRPVRAKEFAPITTSWQEIYIPLEKFIAQGVDLSHLEAIQIVFEWEEMSGTVYIADIRFE